MFTKINPISLFGFGTADAMNVRLVGDDLVSSAIFFYQLGKMITPEKVRTQSIVDGVPQKDEKTQDPIIVEVQPPDQFVGADNFVGNVTLSGEEYLKWSGNNDDVPNLVASKVQGITIV